MSATKWQYIIKDIKVVSDTDLIELTKLMNKDCQPGKYSLIELRDTFAKTMDILYIKDDDKFIHFMLLDIFPKHKSVYIHDVCVAKSHRGQGIFKSALAFLKTHYKKKGIETFRLDASDSTKEKGLDQKARIAIFTKAGFHINPKTDVWNDKGEFDIVATKVKLESGNTVEIIKPEKDNQYTVKNTDGTTSIVAGTDIKRCYGLDGKYISCPMILNLKSKRKTRKRKHT